MHYVLGGGAQRDVPGIPLNKRVVENQVNTRGSRKLSKTCSKSGFSKTEAPESKTRWTQLDNLPNQTTLILDIHFLDLSHNFGKVSLAWI